MQIDFGQNNQQERKSNPIVVNIQKHEKIWINENGKQTTAPISKDARFNNIRLAQFKDGGEATEGTIKENYEE